MKVKFTYTTNLDNVPYDCWRLLDYKISSGEELKNQLLELYKDLDESSISSSTFKKIHKLRLTLASYDQCLDDINNILSGWTQVQLQQQNKDVIVDKQTENDDND